MPSVVVTSITATLPFSTSATASRSMLAKSSALPAGRVAPEKGGGLGVVARPLQALRGDGDLGQTLQVVLFGFFLSRLLLLLFAGWFVNVILLLKQKLGRLAPRIVRVNLDAIVAIVVIVVLFRRAGPFPPVVPGFVARNFPGFTFRLLLCPPAAPTRPTAGPGAARPGKRKRLARSDCRSLLFALVPYTPTNPH